MKNTMSNRNIARYHKLLKLKYDLEEISTILKVDEDTLKRFSPKIMAGVKVSKKAAADKAYGKKPQPGPQTELDLGDDDGPVKSETVEVEEKPKTTKKSAASAVADKG